MKTPHDVAELQSVMRAIDDGIADVVAEMPARRRPFIPNALLNLSVEWLLAAEGTAVAVSILNRLAERISSGERPQGDEAIPLTRFDA
jgi:hypothetical protein